MSRMVQIKNFKILHNPFSYTLKMAFPSLRDHSRALLYLAQ